MEIAYQKHSSVADSIYNILRVNILSLKFLPGRELNLNELSERLKISKSPIREALLKLAADGLVDIYPQRGTFVALIDLQRVEEERFLRLSLESSALKQFLKMHRKNDIYFLEEAYKRQNIYLEDGNLEDFIIYDNIFHSVFFTGINKSICWQIIDNQCGHLYRTRLLAVSNPEIAQEVLVDHMKLIEAISAEKNDDALELLDKHLKELTHETHKLQQMHPEYFIGDIE